jgi:tRNA U34 5-methylaminomethyl-2-thiouridine-forming methyltransferase MnmC
MSLKLIVTDDGSHSIEGEGGGTYHSTFGAIRESRHVFVGTGLHAAPPGPLCIFEMGLGTGLNALLCLIEAIDSGRPIRYETVETNPLPAPLVRELNYCRLLGRPELQGLFEQLHAGDWDTPVGLCPEFELFKSRHDLRDHALVRPADLVFYDAFDPVTQPQLWTREVFEGLIGQLAPGAILVTYCCKGEVQRALRASGFRVEKLPGPPGKREILRATAP